MTSDNIQKCIMATIPIMWSEVDEKPRNTVLYRLMRVLSLHRHTYMQAQYTRTQADMYIPLLTDRTHNTLTDTTHNTLTDITHNTLTDITHNTLTDMTHNTLTGMTHNTLTDMTHNTDDNAAWQRVRHAGSLQLNVTTTTNR